MQEPNYTEFSDPRLVAIYDTANGIGEYKNFYLDLAKKFSPKSILDIGAGSGLLTSELAKLGPKIVGIEPSKELLAIARQRPGCEGVRWVEGYVQQLDDTKVDLAIMTGHVAQFFLDDKSWHAALTKIHDALNTGGHLVFESRNPLVPTFGTWPTTTSHRKLTDPVVGEFEWWAENLNQTGNKVRYEIHYQFAQSEEELVSVNELIFRSQKEISQSLIDTGFSIQNVYGDWNQSIANTASPEMIFVATRDAS